MASANPALGGPAAVGIELDPTDFTQEIDSPFLGDPGVGRDVPTLSRIDFEDIELALDLVPRVP